MSTATADVATRPSAVQIAEALDLPAPTDEQRAVIEAPLSPLLVVAGAGSGKTETMAARVVWLVAGGEVRPEEVLGLTFTRKAAAELADRVRRRLRRLRSSGLWRPVAGDEELGDRFGGVGLGHGQKRDTAPPPGLDGGVFQSFGQCAVTFEKGCHARRSGLW